MSPLRLIALTALTMTAFASNSLLCRVALKQAHIAAADFTTIRLVSGALVLGLLARRASAARTLGGSWTSALALLTYAAGFSFAYVSLPAATGALVLFGAVQATMIGRGWWCGERFTSGQWLGLLLAVGGLIGLLLPGLTAPPLVGSLLMLLAGAAWGVYSLRGKTAGPPLPTTAGNFLRAVPAAVVLNLLLRDPISADTVGWGCAVASGAVSSGIGYAVWYTVLPALKATQAATVQLSVPVLAALGGVAFLGEPITLRLLLASAAVLGGILLVLLEKRSPATVGR